jgi:hypothetical protein
VRTLAAALAGMLLGGCATLDARRAISAAASALEEARLAGGDRAAPYEYTLAAAQVDKAREENARARYGEAVDHADQARKLFDEATRRAAAARARGEAR